MSTESGFRSVCGAIRVTDGALYIISYDALTMAGQFKDEELPSKHEQHLRIDLPNGDYGIRLIQRCDPMRSSRPELSEPDFIVEYEQEEAPPGWA